MREFTDKQTILGQFGNHYKRTLMQFNKKMSHIINSMSFIFICTYDYTIHVNFIKILD